MSVAVLAQRLPDRCVEVDAHAFVQDLRALKFDARRSADHASSSVGADDVAGFEGVQRADRMPCGSPTNRKLDSIGRSVSTNATTRSTSPGRPRSNSATP